MGRPVSSYDPVVRIKCCSNASKFNECLVVWLLIEETKSQPSMLFVLGYPKLTWSLLLTGSGFIILAVDWKGEEDVELLDWDLTFQYKDRILEMRWRSCGRWMREVWMLWVWRRRRMRESGARWATMWKIWTRASRGLRRLCFPCSFALNPLEHLQCLASVNIKLSY